MEENTTRDVEESAPSRSMDSSPVSVKQDQEKQDDSSDSDHVSYAHNALTQSAISSSPIAVVEHAKAHTDSVIPVQPSSTPPSASKNGFVVGAAQVVPLDIVSSSSDSRKALPSSPRSAVGQVTLSTPSLGTAESSVPCTLGKRDQPTADEPASLPASEEGGQRFSKLSKFGLWNIFSSFR